MCTKLCTTQIFLGVRNGVEEYESGAEGEGIGEGTRDEESKQ